MKFVRLFRDSVLSYLERLGYRVFKVGPTDNSRITDPYGMVVLDEMYSPWLTDREFLAAYEVIRSHTLVDVYRCYELWTLVDQSAKLDGAILEVGVWRGGTGALIAHRAKLFKDFGSGLPLRHVRWRREGMGRDSYYQGGEHGDTSRAQVEDLIHRKLDLPSVVVLEGVFPEETSRYISDQRFRLCHVDVDVYQSAKDIVDWIWDRLVVGGMVIYDDYGFRSCDGITRYVEEQRAFADRLVVHNLNKHAVVIKIR